MQLVTFLLFHRANWTNIAVAAEDEVPTHDTIVEVNEPRSPRNIFITSPNPLLFTTKDRGYV